MTDRTDRARVTPAAAGRGSTTVLGGVRDRERHGRQRACHTADDPPAAEARRRRFRVSPAGTVQLADMIERVQPAVVNISVTQHAGSTLSQYSGPDPRSFQGTPFDDMLRRFFEMQPERRAAPARFARARLGLRDRQLGLRRHEQPRRRRTRPRSRSR